MADKPSHSPLLVKVQLKYLLSPDPAILTPNHTQTLPPTPQPNPRVAIITGITGQDGLYLAAHLLFKQSESSPPYIVHGVCRKNSINLPILLEMQSPAFQQQ